MKETEKKGGGANGLVGGVKAEQMDDRRMQRVLGKGGCVCERERRRQGESERGFTSAKETILRMREQGTENLVDCGERIEEQNLEIT